MSRRTKGERRRDAVEACRERFWGKDYKPGLRDCVRLAAHAMHHMGHGVSLMKGVRYSTEAGGLKALKKLGFDDLLSAVDATGLERIAPAAALPADLIALPSGDALGVCLYVYAGNGKALGYKEDHDVALMISLSEPPLTAWRL